MSRDASVLPLLFLGFCLFVCLFSHSLQGLSELGQNHTAVHTTGRVYEVAYNVVPQKVLSCSQLG